MASVSMSTRHIQCKVQYPHRYINSNDFFFNVNCFHWFCNVCNLFSVVAVSRFLLFLFLLLWFIQNQCRKLAFYSQSDRDRERVNAAVSLFSTCFDALKASNVGNLSAFENCTLHKCTSTYTKQNIFFISRKRIFLNTVTMVSAKYYFVNCICCLHNFIFNLYDI